MHPVFRLALATLMLLSMASVLHAQPYPNKPIRILVGFAAGGPIDVAARLLSQRLAERWGQAVVVEPRTGTGGNIVAEAVAKAAPDGYTRLLPAFAHAVNPSLYPNLPFDTGRDFVPVALLTTSANVFAVHPSVPAHTLRELITLAKSKPGELSYGSAGVASASHLAGELLKSMAGIKLTHIPYKCAALAS